MRPSNVELPAIKILLLVSCIEMLVGLRERASSRGLVSGEMLISPYVTGSRHFLESAAPIAWDDSNI